MAEPSPPAKAAVRGHQLAWDPPHALTAAKRWTCARCGDAVLDYRGNVYGAATERDCPHPTQARAAYARMDAYAARPLFWSDCVPAEQPVR